MIEQLPTMSHEDFVRLGYLQEVNRQFLHPLGLALAVDVVADAHVLWGVIDYRTDPEGVAFEELTPEMLERARFIQAEQRRREPVRYARAGYVRQPFEGETEDRDRLVVSAAHFAALDRVAVLAREHHDTPTPMRDGTHALLGGALATLAILEATPPDALPFYGDDEGDDEA